MVSLSYSYTVWTIGDKNDKKQNLCGKIILSKFYVKMDSDFLIITQFGKPVFQFHKF